MDKFLTLSALRKVVQLFFFVLLVYGSLFFSTFYSNDKFTKAWPSLTCAYDKHSGDYCALVPLQHQMDHRVSSVIEGTTSLVPGLIGTIITLGTFFILIVILNKAFCGWTCPLGFFQEIVAIVGRKLKLKQIKSLSKDTLSKVRPIKWFMFLFLVILFPLLSGLDFMSHDMGDPFCKVCPSRILTTLAVGDASQLYIDNSSTTYMVLSIIADLLFGLMIALALFVRQPFCRICPMLPLQTVFKKAGLFRLVKNGGGKCDSCNNCAKACPMDIYEIANKETDKNITYADCTLCGRCVEFCPDNDILKLKYGPFTVFKSSNQYFKKRNKLEKFIFKK